MVRYFLAPRSGEKSYQNFLSTIKHGVPFSRIESYLTEEGKNILRNEEVIYSWGNREGKRHEWEKINRGDVIIFYAKGNLVMAGEVIYKQHSPDLALAMWPADEAGQPWAYTFFLNDLRYFKIPIAHFNLISGYRFESVQGFQEIGEENKTKILSYHKDFEELFKTFSDEASVEIPGSEERVYVNVSDQVHPTLSEKKIIAYQPPPENITPKKKKKGYINFDELNRHRAKIGSLGEEIVIRFEKAFLVSKNRPDLASRVHQTSSVDTYAGFDILSYDELGVEKKIEVKATVIEQPENFSFNISKNEKSIAEQEKNYFIYLVYGVNTKTPHIHIIKNPFKVTDALTIEPAGFIARGKFV